MLRASWKSLLGRKLRLFMSAFAIILGVAFVSGSFIFTDTLGKAFDGIVNTVGDVVVRPDVAGSSFEQGRRGTEIWATRNEGRIREEVAAAIAARPKHLAVPR